MQAELHVYANVGHGFGVRPERAGQSQQEWTTQLVAFLRQAKSIGTRVPRLRRSRTTGLHIGFTICRARTRRTRPFRCPP